MAEIVLVVYHCIELRFWWLIPTFLSIFRVYWWLYLVWFYLNFVVFLLSLRISGTSSSASLRIFEETLLLSLWSLNPLFQLSLWVSKTYSYSDFGVVKTQHWVWRFLKPLLVQILEISKILTLSKKKQMCNFLCNLCIGVCLGFWFGSYSTWFHPWWFWGDVRYNSKLAIMF